ncbi:MAG TPA: hypothetical protein VIX86_00630 [Streptosporangiaceae bacterium]
MRAAYRVRLVANLVNGSTLAGVLVAAAGRARLARGHDGLLIGERYRLPVPPAPAFTLGNMIVTKMGRDELAGAEALLVHEARHATQFACCAGLLMLPLYFLAAAWSWLLTGDFGARNVFERLAGLSGGGYVDRPLRPAVARWPLARWVAGPAGGEPAGLPRGQSGGAPRVEPGGVPRGRA